MTSVHVEFLCTIHGQDDLFLSLFSFLDHFPVHCSYVICSYVTEFTFCVSESFLAKERSC